MNEFHKKYAIITGGAGGIGAATAFALAKEGVSGIIIADLDKDGALKTAEKIEQNTKCRCEFIKTDIGKGKDVVNLFDKCIKAFNRLDILVNCAGICNTFQIEEIDESRWEKLMAVNLKGTYLSCREALIIMKRQKSGKIINFSSISARVGGIATGVDYVTSKGGIIAMTKSFAKAAGPFGINVNAVAPGFIETGMTKDFTHFDVNSVPLRRPGQPEDVADVVVFLASEKSRYVTGVVIDINGGQYMP